MTADTVVLDTTETESISDSVLGQFGVDDTQACYMMD